jgi:hypothetical protein
LAGSDSHRAAGVREEEEGRPQHGRAAAHLEDGVAALRPVQRNLAREVRRRVADEAEGKVVIEERGRQIGVENAHVSSG